MIQDTDITAWLGDAADELTDEQVAQFTRLVTAHHDEIASRRPGYGTGDYYADDYADDDEAAWIAAYEIATGTFDLPARGRALIEARTSAYQGAVMAVLDGASEIPTAQSAAIARGTLRKLLGK